MLDFIAQSSPELDGAAAGILAGLGVFLFIIFAIWVFMVACVWKVFAKAGKPGWAAIVPIYNIIVLLEIVGKPTWWIILYLIPLVNVVVGIIVINELVKSFGKEVGFTIGMILLPIVFWPLLAFGSAQYQGAPQPAA